MAQQTLNNGETGLSFRGKLNTMFGEVYAWFTSHLSTHPAPTDRDTRNQVAGTYLTSETSHTNVAVVDSAQEFTATQNFNATALVDAATIAWNLAANQATSVTLADNRIVGLPTNMVDGATYALKVIQDATGSRTVTWNAAFKWPAGTAPTLSTGANAVDMIFFYCDGSALYGSAQLNYS